MSDKEVAELFGLKPEETTPQLEIKKSAPQEELPLPPPPPNFKPTIKEKQAPKVYRVKEAAGWIIASILAGSLIAVVSLIVTGII